MSRRILAGVATAAASGALLLGTAAGASASQEVGLTLAPGFQKCVQQYAGYQVRAYGTATNQGAKFKLQLNGATVPGGGSPGLVPAWNVEYRSTWGNFPGSGYYVACVTNNGTANTKVTLVLLTDGEL